MASSFTPNVLNYYLAPGFADFKTCNAPDLSDAHTEVEYWMASHFLNSLLRGKYTGSMRQYAINLIFRAQSTVHDYNEARVLTNEFLEKNKSSSPAGHIYFRAVSRWESCLLNFQIFMNVMSKVRQDFEYEPVFNKNDGTPEQRAFDIANTIKHWGSDIANARHTDGDTIPLWLTDTGFCTRLYTLTYLELGKIVSKVAATADKLRDPRSLSETSP